MRLITRLQLMCILLSSAGAAAALQVDQQSPVSGAIPGYAEIVPEQETHQGGGVSLSQAVAQVRRQYNGQIVSAVTRVSGNRETHIIKVLTPDGKVKTVMVAGRSRN